MRKTFWVILIICACMMLLFACSNETQTNQDEQKQKNDVIHIATKPMTEQLILGEMLAILIEEKTGLQTEITKGVGGGTANIHPALINGEFDLYPEYTGTSWYTVLKETQTPTHETMMEELKKRYNDEFNLRWLGLYGFENTYGIIVRKEIADQYNVSKISDLEAIAPKLVFGANYDYFERPDGFDAFKEAYQKKKKKTVDMDIALRFQALNNAQIDVLNLFTTDAQLSVTEHKILEDDKAFFQDYYAGTVIRNETLEKHPELEAAIALLDGQISEKEMSDMNYEIEENKKDEADVAREFLIAKGIIE